MASALFGSSRSRETASGSNPVEMPELPEKARLAAAAALPHSGKRTCLNCHLNGGYRLGCWCGRRSQVQVAPAMQEVVRLQRKDGSRKGIWSRCVNVIWPS